MTDETHDEDLDALLRRAMRARPLPASAADLAARATRLGQEREAVAVRARIDRLGRRRKLTAIVTAFATVLVALVVYFGAARIQSNLSAARSVRSTSNDSSSSTSSSAQQNVVSIGILLTSEGLLVALILLCGAATPAPWWQARAAY